MRRLLLPLLLIAGLLPFRAAAAASVSVSNSSDPNGSPVELTVPLAPGVPVVVDLADRPQLAFLVGSAPTEITVRSRANGWGTPEHVDVPADAEATILWLGRATDALELTSDTPVTVRVTTVHVAEPEPTIRAMSLLDTGPNGPAIRARTDWATPDRTWDWANPDCSDGPETWPTIEATVIHHTGSGGAYLPATEADVIASIRGIYDFHVGSNGWCDIGYNFVVDASGTMWEARTGGHDLAVQGAHASGFNWITSGILALGSFSTGESTPPTPMVNALGDLAAWKLRTHGRPTGGPAYLKEFSDQPTYPVRLYSTFIGSAPTAAEEADLRTTIATRGRFDAALDLAQSDAWAGVMVESLYRNVLNRVGDPLGRAYWVNQIREGLRFEIAAIYFYASAEYYELHGSDNSRFVTSLYTNLLSRTPDSAGHAYWTQLLASRRSDTAGVAWGFFASDESRGRRVRDLYLSILEREPDVDGHSYWATKLLVIDDVVLAALLASSDEFFGRSAREVATMRVTYHKVLNPTACPGEHMIAAIETVRQRASRS